MSTSLSRTIAEYVAHNSVGIDDLVRVLHRYRLTLLLPQIYTHLTRIQAEHNKTQTLIIESPFPLSEKAVSAITSHIPVSVDKKTVILNKELLAGFKAKYNNIIYDASAKRIINDLKKL